MNRQEFNRLMLGGGLLLGASAFGYRGCHSPHQKDADIPEVQNGYVSSKNGIVNVSLPYSADQLGHRNIRSREAFLITGKTDPQRTVDIITRKYGNVIASNASKFGIDPGMLEGIIYVESGAYSNAVNASGAAGIVQIMPRIAEAYKMDVNYEMSDWCTSEIFRLQKALEHETSTAKTEKIKNKIAGYKVKRAAIDERFNPYKCLEVASHYLGDEKSKFGRDDFAIWTYHTGRTNALDAVLRFIDPKPPVVSGRDAQGRVIIDVQATMKKYGLTYSELYFGCSPYRTNPGTYDFIYRQLIDSSAQYPWNAMAAQRLVRMSKKDPVRFRKLVDKYLAAMPDSPSTRVKRNIPIIEEVTTWYDPNKDHEYTDVNEIISALDKGELVKLPDNPRALGFSLNPKEIGINASSDVREFFYSTKPETVGMLITLASITRHESGKYDQHLTVNSAVRSREYQKRVGSSDFTTHALGRGVDISRRYKSGRQATAFQYALDRLRDGNMIRALKEDEGHLHLVVNSDPEVVKYFQQVYKQTMELVA
ncbi:MAG: transglycosylase SLT domain-containing protein [Candidatus Aenigmarchaeota archaeon]|nr:transglycosylase SLT domain-containing protein [Candidatus Aenigmarchaeota archaeon]